MTDERPAFPRPLTEREAATLAFILSADDKRLSPLREQAKTATVVGMCGCGCATIDLEVDRNVDNQAYGLWSDPVGTTYAQRDAPEVYFLNLFIEDGWLSSLRISWIEDAPTEFPPIEMWDPPQFRDRGPHP